MKNLFLLSASSDNTVRLWHMYKSESLCCFYHSSIITAISFHPKNDRLFVSACSGGKLRLWSIAEKKVLRFNDLGVKCETNNNLIISAICFCQSGKTLCVGTYTGLCVLYQTEVSNLTTVRVIAKSQIFNFLHLMFSY
jgi:WD40 repeat protein